MPEPTLTHDERHPPSAEMRSLGRTLFNLFPRWDVRLHGELDSTSSEARRWTLELGGDAWPRIILADYQFAGRGRQGKSWIAPRRSSLLVTVMAPRQLFPEPYSLLPLAVGCWVLEGLDRLGVAGAELKWPNDLLVNGQKIAGILCEASGAALMVGIGVNLDQSEEELPRRTMLEPQATSVRIALGDAHPGWLVAAITIMSALMENAENPPSKDWVLERYRTRCATMGTSVALKTPGGASVVGVARDVDATGALIVETEDGTRRSVAMPVEDPGE